jgi:predicted dehydrogenase
MEVKRRVAVAGLGSIGKRHVRLLRERGDVDTELGTLPSHASFESMLDSRPDVVWLASPTHLHAAQSVAAMQAGAHVFCGKPMTYSVAEAQPVLAAARSSRKVFNVGFYLRFSAGLNALKHVVETGSLGQVLHARAHVGTYLTLVNSISHYQARLSGSLFFDYSHQPDLFFWMFHQRPSSISVFGRQDGGMELTSDPKHSRHILRIRLAAGHAHPPELHSDAAAPRVRNHRRPRLGQAHLRHRHADRRRPLRADDGDARLSAGAGRHLPRGTSGFFRCRGRKCAPTTTADEVCVTINQ